MANEWQTRNAGIRYPLSEQDATAEALSPQLPDGFLVDCRVFLNGQTEADAYLSRVEYDGANVTLEFNRYSDGEALISGSLAYSGAGEQIMLHSGPRVALLMPGPDWVSTFEGGAAAPFALAYDRDATRVEPGNVVGGGGVEKILLAAPYYNALGELQEVDETFDPPDVDNQYGATEQFVAGYNMQMSAGGGALEFDVVPGAGEGPVPCWYSVGEVIRTINRIPPDEFGNFRIVADECYRISRTNDEILGVPVTNALWLFNDCPPCCECFDYTKSSRAVSRMSAKFRDLNDELNAVMTDVQATYEEAVDLINQSASTMISVRNIHIYPSHISIDVANVSRIPAYAVVSLKLGADLQVRDSPALRPGIDLASMQAMDPHYQETGIADEDDVEGWRVIGENWTVGYGENFDPIPPGEHTRIWLRSDSSFEDLDCLDEECHNYQSYLNDVLPDPLVDDDWADLLEAQADLINLIDEVCTGGENLDCAQEERCWHQQMARIQQWYDLEVEKLIYRIELALGVVGDPCYAPTMTGPVASLVAEYLATNDIVPDGCKDGVGPDDDVTGDDTDGCDHPGHDDEVWDLDSSQCRAYVRQQMAERESILRGGGPVTESTEQNTDVVQQEGLLLAVRTLIEDRYEEMIAEMKATHIGSNVGSLGFSSFGVYGETKSFSCSAFTKLYEIDDDDTTPADLNPFECLTAVLGIFRFSIERSDINLPEPLTRSTSGT